MSVLLHSKENKNKKIRKEKNKKIRSLLIFRMFIYSLRLYSDFYIYNNLSFISNESCTIQSRLDFYTQSIKTIIIRSNKKIIFRSASSFALLYQSNFYLFSLSFYSLRCMTANTERHSDFSLWRVNVVCKQLTSFQLPQRMGKAEFSSTAKNRTNSAPIGKNTCSLWVQMKTFQCTSLSFLKNTLDIGPCFHASIRIFTLLSVQDNTRDGSRNFR